MCNAGWSAIRRWCCVAHSALYRPRKSTPGDEARPGPRPSMTPELAGEWDEKDRLLLMMPLAWFISRGTQTVGICWACGANLNRDKHPVPHCR